MDPWVSEIVKAHWKKIKKRPNVIGYSGKLQSRRIDATGEVLTHHLCFRVYVKVKDKTIFPSKKECIPRKLEIKGNKVGLNSGDIRVETDVWQIGEQVALEDSRAKHRPLVGGISSNHCSGGACTGNIFWRDKKTNSIYYSSNNHGYARENQANLGDAILQPSPLDGGTQLDKIGELVEYVPIQYNEFTCPFRNFFHRIYRAITGEKVNKVDIAFCTIEVPYEIEVLPGKKIAGKAVPVINEKVWKIGRTSGYTEGVVVDLDWNGTINYSRGKAFFTDCILIHGAFSKPGDSGSPVFKTIVELFYYYIGALHAGSDTDTVVSKVDNIESIGKKELVIS